MGFSLVDSLVRFLLAMVAPPFLGFCLACPLVVVDSLVVVHPLVLLGLVVGSGVVGLVGLVVVVVTMDFLAPVVVYCPQTRPAVVGN